jgi:beta-fructofuranosidase
VRPQFHFTATSGWINDPHGIGFRDGAYDAFYQYVPDSVEWRLDCQWGHARGPDLMSLSERPIALAPGDGDDGIWTGALVRAAGSPDRIFYTAVNQPGIGVGRVRVATAIDDEWSGWAKGAVVATAPADLGVLAYRDPFVLEESDGSWRMFVGAALAGGSAAVLSYHSADLLEWTYDGIALQRSSREQDPVWTGELWECPQIVAVGDRHLMIFSVWSADTLHYAAYAIGRYADGRFDADDWGRLTFGPSYYAPSVFLDADGHPGVIFWMRGIGDSAEGWAGAHSVPYRLGVDRGRPLLAPHPDLHAYRRDPAVAGVVDGLAADAIWTPGRSLVVHSGAVEAAALAVDNAILTLQVGPESWRMPYVGGPIRLVVDGPTIEVSSRCGLIGGPLSAPTAPLRFVSDSPVTVWQLAR